MTTPLRVKGLPEARATEVVRPCNVSTACNSPGTQPVQPDNDGVYDVTGCAAPMGYACVAFKGFAMLLVAGNSPLYIRIRGVHQGAQAITHTPR